jgi:hypothetical protein
MDCNERQSNTLRRRIAEATPIILTSEERPELESLACSTKTEYARASRHGLS